MKHVAHLLALTVLAAAPSGAAVYMKSHTYGSGPDERQNRAVEMRFEGWFVEDRAVLNVLESGQSALSEGKIFIDGTTMTLYDPEENTCAPWDVQAMLRFAGELMEGMGGILQLEFGEPEIEVLEQGSGGTLLGRSVDYIKYRSDWTMALKAPLMKKRTFDNSTVQELWYDQRLLSELPSLGVFMDPESFTTGYEEMDKAIAAGMPPVEGAVLKSIATSQTTNQKGEVSTTSTTTEVTELDLSASDPAGGYAPPADCQVVASPLVGDAAAGDGEEAAAEDDQGGKPWQKIKNPFRKKKDKDDG